MTDISVTRVERGVCGVGGPSSVRNKQKSMSMYWELSRANFLSKVRQNWDIFKERQDKILIHRLSAQLNLFNCLDGLF